MENTTEPLAAYIAALVAGAPRFTAEQLDLLSVQLTPMEEKHRKTY